ncbi:type II toxin-antitoxin system Phd/YefM family antitoxin [Oxalobacteraceae bacterium OTU3CINTB1]|nr:type II toxin-antitoxin system Phd/YefM family antitoxin [Oxalobacteraceae bacterium OTU3CINTB1]
MTITTLPIEQFLRKPSDATNAADSDPVFITERGRPTHVLIKFSDYQRLIREHRNMAELLSVPDMADIDFEPVRSRETATPADLS